MRKSAFTLIELIFVIVIMGILSKYGIELLFQAYNSFIFSKVNNELQSQSTAAVESVASRLQYRIKDSVIARQTDDSFQALAGNTDFTAPILEWVGYDADGLRGSAATTPLWSGIIDLDPSTATTLVSPATDTATLNTLVGALSPGATTINDAALYFVGSDSDIRTGYGWDGNLSAINTQNGVMHPIRRSTVAGEENLFIPVRGDNGNDNNLTGVNVYEYYQLAWTAYAVGIRDYNAGTKTGTLMLYYDYQPWKGENYLQHGTAVKLMDNVSTFRFRAAGSIVKIQVCVNSDLMEDYSLCKEKTVF
ncbi:MAG: type II secretion system protein [Sulfurimonas sp.]|uniref:type II secretion system protein n=1 Tax=Sulfurimonas sp. TaxID=2022749 RepID=UPI00262960CF|nr:type II secretion system protein [Sulfurimonas sp.]MDD2652469.1 type II secretion system protein [Sulfurimonas sp.]MDD3452206.1 type II secretion system protein [Sulfurimonas sp.]